MRRREFLGLFDGAAVACPSFVRAQEPRPIRIGMLPLGSSSSAYDRWLVEAFRQGLRQLGLVENRDFHLDVVWIGGDPDETAKQLIERGAELLIPCGSSSSVVTAYLPFMLLPITLAAAG